MMVFLKELLRLASTMRRLHLLHLAWLVGFFLGAGRCIRVTLGFEHGIIRVIVGLHVVVSSL